MGIPGGMIKNVRGNTTVNNAGALSSIIPASSVPAGQNLYVRAGIITVQVAAAGGGGKVQLEDTASTVYWAGDANAVGSVSFNFGVDGFKLPTGLGLQVRVIGAVTTQATAYAMFAGYVGDDDSIGQAWGRRV